MECPFGLHLQVYKATWDETSFCVREVGGQLITGGLPEAKADYIVHVINSHEKLVKHIEALKSVCETYIPTDKMDEANSKVILLCMGNVEEIGRKLLEAEK